MVQLLKFVTTATLLRFTWCTFAGKGAPAPSMDVTVTSVVTDWLPMGSANTMELAGDFSLPPGYIIQYSTAVMNGPNGSTVTAIGISHQQSTVMMSVPAFDEIGMYCFSLAVTLGTQQGPAEFSHTALGGVKCVYSFPPLSNLGDASINNGPPSGGTYVSFQFAMSPRSDTYLLDCVFGTIRTPVTYTYPLVPTDLITGSCISPTYNTNTAEYYVCVSLAPSNTTYSAFDGIQATSGSPCVSGGSFPFNYYAQMPVLRAIDPNTVLTTGGNTIEISGFQFPQPEALGVIRCGFGDFSGSGYSAQPVYVIGSVVNDSAVSCPNVPGSTVVSGAFVDQIDGILKVNVSLSFNDGNNYSNGGDSGASLLMQYNPDATLVSVNPSIGLYSGGTNLTFSVSYGNPSVLGVPLVPPIALCIFTPANPSNPTVQPLGTFSALLTTTSVISLDILTLTGLGTAPASPVPYTVQLSLKPALGGVCQTSPALQIPFDYRADWTATNFTAALLTGGGMTMTVTGTNFFAPTPLSQALCRARAIFPINSQIESLLGENTNPTNPTQYCDALGTLTVTNATSGFCAITLSTQFYECSYAAFGSESVATLQLEEHTFFDAMSVQMALSYNGGLNFATVTQTDQTNVTRPRTVRAIRLPQLDALSPDFGFDFGGYAVEVRLKTGIAWEITTCKFVEVSSGIVRTVSGSAYSIRSVGCVAPQWRLTTLISAFQVSVLIDSVNNVYTAPLVFQMRKSPVISNVNPREGPPVGGSVIKLFGHHFDNLPNESGIQCVFNSASATPAVIISATTIQCQSPKWLFGDAYVPLDVTVSWLAKDSRVTTVSVHQSLFLYRTVQFDVLSITPLSGPISGGTPVTITTQSIIPNNGIIDCVFGTIHVSAVWNNSTQVVCTSPPIRFARNVQLYMSSDGVSTRPFKFLSVINGNPIGSSNYLNFVYYYPPTVYQGIPTFGSSLGGTSVLFQGSNFVNDTNISCLFGNNFVKAALFISSNSVVCNSPPGTIGAVPLSVSNNGIDFVSGLSAYFTYTESQPMIIMDPALGPVTGGTSIRIYSEIGPLPSANSALKTEQPKCSFGSYTVTAVVTDETSGDLLCVSPAVPSPGYVTVAVYFNGQEAAYVSQQFLFYAIPAITAVIPPLGPQGVPNQVTILGANFANTQMLTVRFGTINTGYVDVVGLWISENQISATAPAESPSNVSLRLPVMVSNNGQDFVPQAINFWSPNDDTLDVLGVIQYYTLHVPVNLKLVYPSFADTHGGGYVSVYGGPFVDTGLAGCGFDWIKTDPSIAAPIFISTSHILCPVPNMWAAGSSSALSRSVKLQVALVDNNWSDSYLDFRFINMAPPGFYVPHLNPSTFASVYVPCRTGHMCEDFGLSAPIQCPPGYYQPYPNRMQCLVCPVGYYCSYVRSEKPIVCDPGWVCDQMGLVVPYKRCPGGYICLAGTATADPIPDEPFNAVAPDTLSNAGLNGPFKCPLGLFCVEGVSAFVSIPGNMTTPQPCYPGYYCRPGSSSPFGVGGSPLGRFSPTPRIPGILCRPGFFCGPTTGNLAPTPCSAGTYNGLFGQHNCTLAYEGTTAPAPMMTRPLISECGHVAGRKGISALGANDLCPPAMTCYYGVGAESEPPICQSILTTNTTEIAALCQPSIGQIYYPPGAVESFLQAAPTRLSNTANGQCCWTQPLVVELAERVVNIFKSDPLGNELSQRSADRFRQQILADPTFNGAKLIETVNATSLVTVFNVHIGDVRNRILYEIERHYSFKSPDPCAPGVFCNAGTCTAYPTVLFALTGN